LQKRLYVVGIVFILIGCQSNESIHLPKNMNLHQTKNIENISVKENIPEHFLVKKIEQKVEKTEQQISNETTTTAKVNKEEKPTKNEPAENNQIVKKEEKKEEPFIEDPNRPYLLPLNLSEPRKKPISHVVIHFMSNASNKPKDPYIMNDIVQLFKSYGVSSHYVIDREGNIHQLVEENRVAYHAGRGKLPGFPETDQHLNHYSIGIELLAIGTKDEMKSMMEESKYSQIHPSHIGYTERQYESLKKLLLDIHSRHPQVLLNRDYIVGHQEYSPQKTDPGVLFDWTKIGLPIER